MSDKGQTSQEGQSVETNEARKNHQSVNDSQIASGCEKSSEMSDDDKLIYDWEDCEMLQIVRAFSISDYGTEYQLNQPSVEYPLVSEPPTLSEIIDSTTSNPQPRTMSDVEENYVEYDLSSLTDVSDIKVSNAPRKYEFVKERVQRKDNVYDKLYNACLKGQITISMGYIKKPKYQIKSR